MLALAPDVIIGGIGLLLASGVAYSVTRTVSVIWVNQRTTSDVRATVHSFLSQAETAGEIAGGLALLATAQAKGMPATFIASGALIVCAGALVALLGTPRRREGNDISPTPPSGHPGSPDDN
jgi:predicted MFS family arabinose efflux permease